MNYIAKERHVMAFICRHPLLLAYMRGKTQGRDLIRCVVTRFATSFLTLQSLFTFKEPLCSLFVSDVWSISKWANKPEGLRVSSTILSVTFWKNVRIALLASQPIMEVLWLVDGDENHAMGYFYFAMERVREKIKTNFGEKEREYKPILEIFDKHWNNLMQHPLHLGGFFLNPALLYKAKAEDEASIGKFELGFIDCIERMVSDVEIQDKISHQMEEYKHARGAFYKEMAIRQRETKQPVDWWHTYGHCTPNLRRIALYILGLTCTSSACERNWSTFEHIHTKKRNRHDQKRLNDLVFVQYNQCLRERFLTRCANPWQFDPICFDDVDESSEWLTGRDPSNELIHEGGDLTWNEVDEAIGATEAVEGANRPWRSAYMVYTRTNRSGGRGGHGRGDGRGQDKGKSVVQEEEDEDSMWDRNIKDNEDEDEDEVGELDGEDEDDVDADDVDCVVIYWRGCGLLLPKY
ncbi:PREDICTED: uncharacterized protein LOC104589025 [Nelumbo nucifera]|uniref:HAT C-terminal dimerisation domain-containing protein n=2 Tax=Nelumbo nucifera TaxID=4432 RepID=A0A822YCQ6_NELNU|nr:PREDICTED: uncharacterized protein LOC104589025 [Nelumbo nucifera]DAD29301.1 TPA_asm: hypothetical protein HUJ06_030769 [Nelumbo nucifera]